RGRARGERRSRGGAVDGPRSSPRLLRRDGHRVRARRGRRDPPRHAHDVRRGRRAVAAALRIRGGDHRRAGLVLRNARGRNAPRHHAGHRVPHRSGLGNLVGSRRLSRHARLPAERTVPEDAVNPGAAYTVIRATRASRIGGGVFALLLAALATFPLWADRGWMRDFDEFACYFLFALMWNLLAGYGGMVSIGQQAFFGIGGYALLAMGKLLHLDHVLAVSLPGLVGLLLTLTIFHSAISIPTHS